MSDLNDRQRTHGTPWLDGPPPMPRLFGCAYCNVRCATAASLAAHTHRSHARQVTNSERRRLSQLVSNEGRDRWKQ